MTTPAFNKDYPTALDILKKTGKNRTISDFDKIIPIIERSLENSENIITEFADVKYYLNRFVDESYNELIDKKFLHAGKYAEQPEELQWLSSPSEIRSIGPYLKKLNKLSPESMKCEMYSETKKLTDELFNLHEVYNFLKDHTVKASVKKKEAKEIKEAQEDEWMKKMVNHKDTKKVINLLKNTIASIEDKMYSTRLASLNYIVDGYKKKIESGESDYTEIYKKNGFAKMCIQGLLKRVGEDYRSKAKKEFALVDNYKELIEKQAKDYATEIGNTFVYKNTNKLSYILYTKDNLDTVEINNVNLGSGYIECDLTCKFKDSSEFLANTSVVLSYSKYDTPFYRYPTIFRNVKMPDGSKLVEPSEERMDELFATNNVTAAVVRKNKMK
jgi:hypothetical protein